jgi:hypothetical protein
MRRPHGNWATTGGCPYTDRFESTEQRENGVRPRAEGGQTPRRSQFVEAGVMNHAPTTDEDEVEGEIASLRSQ